MADDDGVPRPQRYGAILAMAIAVMLAALDGNITNVALPVIARDLNTSPAMSIWVVNAYQIAVTIALIPLSSAGDIFGYRRIYIAGLAVLVIGSLACSLSESLPILAMARFVQGCGAAGIMSVNQALVRFVYPRSQLGRGIAVNAVTVATTSAAGPSVGAAILHFMNWPWIFAVNIPFGLAALLFSIRYLPRTARSGAKFDLLSAVYSAFAFGCLIGGLNGLGHELPASFVVAELLVAAVAAILLVRRQVKLPVPLLAVDLFRIPAFALSSATSVCCFVGFTLALVSLPFYFFDAFGRSQVEVGLLMTPWPLMVVIMAPISGRLADRYSAGVLGGIGLASLSLGLLLMAFLPAGASTLDIVWRMAVCGFGFGTFQTPNNRVLMMSAPRERSGGASGVLAASRLLGQSTGAAFAALIFGLVTAEAGNTGHAAFLSLLAAAACVAAAALVSLLRLIDFQQVKAR